MTETTIDASERKPISLAEFLSGATLPETTIPIVQNSALLADREALIIEIDKMRRTQNVTSRRGSPIAQLERQVTELDAKIDSQAVPFRFRAASPDWVKENRALAKAGDKGDLEAAEQYEHLCVAACSVEPKMTVEETHRLRQAIGESQWSIIRGAVFALTWGEAPRTPFVPATSEQTQ